MTDTKTTLIEIISDALDEGSLTMDEIHEVRDYLHEAAKDMRRQEGAKVAAKLRAGSKVRISMNAALRPKYILGTEATVEKVNQTTATIILGEVYGGTRFFQGQSIRCPLDALELAE